MEIDWEQVKRITLWQYEDLIVKLLEVLNYGFVQEHYNHTISEAIAYSVRIQQGYVENGKEAAFIREIRETLQDLELAGVRDTLDLVQRVRSRSTCAAFLEGTGVGFVALIQVLNYLLRWVTPFKCYVRELLDASEETQFEILKQHKIRSNLDVLENFRFKMDRERFSGETGLRPEFMLKLVHRADISRLAYVRGKTVRHLCGAGYDTLDKLARADINKMEADMNAYFAAMGRRFSNFRRVIPLDWMIGGAGVLPRVVEE